jgi:hypothetical protein
MQPVYFRGSTAVPMLCDCYLLSPHVVCHMSCRDNVGPMLNSCCCVCIHDQPQQAVVAAGGRPAVVAAAAGWRTPTSCMNFLQTGRMSLERVAENIITCFSWGVFRKISCTSRLISKDKKAITFSTSKIFLIKKGCKKG